MQATDAVVRRRENDIPELRPAPCCTRHRVGRGGGVQFGRLFATQEYKPLYHEDRAKWALWRDTRNMSPRKLKAKYIDHSHAC